MTYQSVHTGPEVDAAVAVLNDVQEIRDEVDDAKETVVNLAGQVQTDAGNAAADALTASQAASDALDSKNAAYASEQAASGHAANADSARAQAVVARNGAEDAQDSAWEAEGEVRYLLSDSEATIDSIRAEILRQKYGAGPYPSLDLGMVGANVLDRRVEFTRASSATYFDAMGVLQTAQLNEPRFDYDPVTGKSLGLLVEGQATNLLLWSEDFTQWSYSRTAITQGGVVAPDGTPTGSKVESDGTAGSVYLRVNSDEAIVGQPYTVSVYAKRSELSEFQIQFRSISSSTPGVIFDLDDGTASVSSGALDAYGIEGVGGGWYRCYATLTAEVSDSLFAWLYLGIDVQGGNGIYIWGAQLEVGTHPTSYIKTEASQVTRAADGASIETDDWYNPNEGTFVVSGKADIGRTLIHIADSLTASVGCTVERLPSGAYQVYSRDLSAGLNDIATLASTNDQVTIAFSIKRGGRVRASMNGSAVSIGSGAGGAWNGDASHVFIGNGAVGGGMKNLRQPNHPLRRLTYFPRAFPDAKLEELSTL